MFISSNIKQITILGYHEQSLAILENLRQSQAISVNLGLSRAILDYLGLSWTIWDYQCQLSSIRAEVEAEESKLLLFETFFFFLLFS